MVWSAGVEDTLGSSSDRSVSKFRAVFLCSAGYAYGSCKGGRSWGLSVSSPYAAMVKVHKVKLAARLQHYCRGLQARYAPSGWQRTQLLAVKQHELVLPRQGNGLVAARQGCLPLESSIAISRYWGLIRSKMNMENILDSISLTRRS